VYSEKQCLRSGFELAESLKYWLLGSGLGFAESLKYWLLGSGIGKNEMDPKS